MRQFFPNLIQAYIWSLYVKYKPNISLRKYYLKTEIKAGRIHNRQFFTLSPGSFLTLHHCISKYHVQFCRLSTRLVYHGSCVGAVYQKICVCVMTQTSWTLGSIIIIQNDTRGAPTSACVNAGVPGREWDRHLWCCCVKSKSNPTPGFTDISATHRNLLMLPYALNSCCGHSHTHTHTHRG